MDGLVWVRPSLTMDWRSDFTFANYLAQCLSVIRELCDWFTIVPRLSCPVVNSEREMVSGYGACYSGSEGLDGFHCCPCRCVL